jgi:hypothetical protein
MVLLVSARAMPAVGSSSSRSFGSWLRHIAISSRRLSPRDSEAACMSRFSSMLTSSSIASAAATMSRSAAMVS